MTTYKAKCAICGKEFERISNRSKYCGKKCAEIGRMKSRREWIDKTDYNEKQRIRAQKIREEREAAAGEAERIAREAREQLREGKVEEMKRAEEERFAESLKNREPWARMKQALKEGGMNNSEYWEAWKADQVQYCAKFGRKCTSSVNEIPVTEEDFGNKVVQSMKEQNRCIQRSSWE